MNTNMSLYSMENNKYFGRCLVVVYHASQSEMKNNGLTSADIALYIKTKEDISDINSIDKLLQTNIFNPTMSVALRISSECQFGMFGDSHCDCEDQRIASLEYINSYGQGIYIQIPQEAQGRGLHYKAAELQLQINGLTQDGDFLGPQNIYDAANILLGTKKVDTRKFTILKKIFQNLNLNSYRFLLLGSSRDKAVALSRQIGLDIENVADVIRKISIDNVGEYLAKIYRKNFSLSDGELREIQKILLVEKNIPQRVRSLVYYIKEDLKNGKKFAVNEKMLTRIVSLCETSEMLSSTKKLFGLAKRPYRENQVEIKISEEDIVTLIKNKVINSVGRLSFEQNYYYDLADIKNIPTRGLKIRLKNEPTGNRRLIESRLVYKTQIDDNEYSITNVSISDFEALEILTGSLEGYRVSYVPVFVSACKSVRYPKLTLLIKRYSRNMLTMAVMGVKDDVDNLMEMVKKFIDVKIIPSPTDIRTVNDEFSMDFNYDALLEEEMERLNNIEEVINERNRNRVQI